MGFWPFHIFFFHAKMTVRWAGPWPMPGRNMPRSCWMATSLAASQSLNGPPAWTNHPPETKGVGTDLGSLSGMFNIGMHHWLLHATEFQLHDVAKYTVEFLACSLTVALVF